MTVKKKKKSLKNVGSVEQWTVINFKILNLRIVNIKILKFAIGYHIFLSQQVSDCFYP